MPDIIILNAAELVIDVSGHAITAYPATGNFMTIEPLADRATFTAQLRSGGIASINNSDARRLTLLVMPHSKDDVYLHKAMRAIGAGQGALSVNVSYGLTDAIKYASGSCVIQTEPTRVMAGDGTEAVSWALIGSFPIAVIGEYQLPSVLTADQINAF